MSVYSETAIRDIKKGPDDKTVNTKCDCCMNVITHQTQNFGICYTFGADFVQNQDFNAFTARLCGIYVVF